MPGLNVRHPPLRVHAHDSESISLDSMCHLLHAIRHLLDSLTYFDAPMSRVRHLLTQCAR
jgi:hypothetical protein